jgi:hypothetical protein
MVNAILFFAMSLLPIAVAASIQPVGLPRLTLDASVVGRAACGDTTWLLTNALQLVELSVPRRVVAVHPTDGLSAKDRIWGLACLQDGSLWTLESAHSLAQLTPSGRVQRRIDIRQPWVNLFGVRQQVVFQQLPTPVAAPLLATASTSNIAQVRPWVGLQGRPADSGSTSVARNLVNCGIAAISMLPCWFADDRRIVLSDGTTVRHLTVRGLIDGTFDRQLPIWDAAATKADTLWVLLTSARSANGRRAADVVLKLASSGAVLARIELKTAARLIVSATDDRCVVLLADGDIAEVGIR